MLCGAGASFVEPGVFCNVEKLLLVGFSFERGRHYERVEESGTMLVSHEVVTIPASAKGSFA